MGMIPVARLAGNQYDKAFELYHLPVVATDLCTFRIPSSSDPGESDHLVRLDDPERPMAVSCTCIAGQLERPCWAMARSLVALDELRQANVWLSRSAPSADAGRASAAGAVVAVEGAAGGFDEAGNPILLFHQRQPRAELLYTVSK